MSNARRPPSGFYKSACRPCRLWLAVNSVWIVKSVFRAARIAMRIGLEQRRRRVQLFLDHQDSAETEQLPGWARYQLVAGDTSRSRALFAKMLQCEWDLLAQAADRQGVSEALAQRCTELELARTQFRQSPQLASVAACAAGR